MNPSWKFSIIIMTTLLSSLNNTAFHMFSRLTSLFCIYSSFSHIFPHFHLLFYTTTSENDNEWMNNKFATAVMMAEQQSNFTLTNYDCDRTLFSQHDNNCLQHHVYQDRSTYHNEVPTSSIGYIVDNRVNANVSHSLFSLSSQSSMSLHLSFFPLYLGRVDVCRSDDYAKTADTLLERNSRKAASWRIKACRWAKYLCSSKLIIILLIFLTGGFMVKMRKVL
jgi:hypothetical protein